jgi:NAD-dependent dihydropyrimidine dehydrogenase PreA subunit
MATTDRPVGDVSEECTDCERVTPHDVAVEILTESTKTQNAEFSREPYRVSECTVCGTTTRTRMNNA